MSNQKKRLDFTLTPTSYFCLALFLFSICFGWLLPSEYGKENGPVEWLQVVVLGIAALVALSAQFQTNLASSRRKLIASSSIFLVLAMLRELSWGRVFYMNNIIFIVIAFFVYSFSQGLHKELLNWLKHDRIPVLDIVIIIAAIFIADIVEHHSTGLFGKRTELFEELFELVSYTGVLSFMINAVYNKKVHSDEPLKLKMNI
ncbi:MAG: hypothetical protein H6Q72_2805 [Firmicutes bacterium]|nr:hypothetical protein [Bacillota bacterium]